MADLARLPFATHPLRESLYDELHSRPFHVVTTPQQISHLAFEAAEKEFEEAFELLRELCRRYNVNRPGADSVSFQQDFGEFTLRWERHMEFYTLTVLRPRAASGEPFRHPALELIPADWVAALPGRSVAAFHMAVDDEELPEDHEALSRYFEGQRLMISEAKGAKVLIATAFRIHGDGFGRFIVKNRGLSDARMGRLTRRLIEMETYRLLAQLSLPIAKRIAPELSRMDQELAELLTDFPHTEGAGEERELLKHLSLQAARLESYRAETNSRFSATKAYHRLVLSRLKAIGEEPLEGYMTLAEFMTRRLNPALRTCESVQAWMEDLSRRIERAGDLLRTRVNLTLQEQNKNLLASMDRRSRLQFRLQETVEGLSVAAISYYMVGLLSYTLGGLPLAEWHLDKKAVLASCVPAVLGAVWWLTHRIKHRLIKVSVAGRCEE